MAADRAGFMEVVCLEGVAAGNKVVEVCERGVRGMGFFGGWDVRYWKDGGWTARPGVVGRGALL
jgi:hypothetical protein